MIFKPVKIGDVKLQIGSLVKFLRKENKISQQELADSLSLSRITIQNLESGKNFTIDTLLKVLQHFDILSDLNDVVLKYRNEREDLESLY